jgi:hypothetical protein
MSRLPAVNRARLSKQQADKDAARAAAPSQRSALSDTGSLQEE